MEISESVSLRFHPCTLVCLKNGDFEFAKSPSVGNLLKLKDLTSDMGFGKTDGPASAQLVKLLEFLVWLT